MADRKLHMMVTDIIIPGKEAVVEKILKEKLIPGLRKQLPNFKWKIYRPVVGDVLGKMILIAEVTPEQLVNYDQWIYSSCAREHGNEETTRYFREWYESLVSSEYTAIVEDPDWSSY